MPRTLDTELLDEFERRLRDRSAVFFDRLRPGLGDEEIDRLSAPLGFDLPEEVRRWYRWQNGSSSFPIILSRAFKPLATDVQSTHEFVQDDNNWHTGWLKVMDEKPYIVFDCGGAADAPVPVWHYDYNFAVPTRPVHPRLQGLRFRVSSL
jgi:hypothetical protein